jgi:hypothetical protein
MTATKVRNRFGSAKTKPAKPVAAKSKHPAPEPEGEDLFSEEQLAKGKKIDDKLGKDLKKMVKGMKAAKDKPKTEKLEKFGIKVRGEQKLVPLDEVKENIWNYNEQSDFVFDKLKASIEEFGFTEPLTVRSANQDGPLDKLEIIGGAHRWKAAVALGMKKIPVIDVGTMSDASLKKFMIVLNETKGKANNDQLAVVLSDLSKEGIDMSVLPMDETEIQSLVSMGDFDWQNTDVTADLGPDGEGGDDDEDGEDDAEYVGLEDVLDIDGIKELDWKKDEAYAKRLKQVMLLGKIAPKSPWQVLDLLISTYYKSVKKTEELPVDEELEEGGEEEDEEDEG